MSVLTLPAPDLSDVADGEGYHYTCCDPDRSLCGLDVTDYSNAGEGDTPQVCPVCALLLEVPCGAAGCPT